VARLTTLRISSAKARLTGLGGVAGLRIGLGLVVIWDSFVWNPSTIRRIGCADCDPDHSAPVFISAITPIMREIMTPAVCNAVVKLK
jgi:hypothetical protein